ncbi:hypothetical protein J6590_093858 [Homalodisca vitripennis]|nr:hypothetical protein J6590_093858 [Homalodisca vitripennis]
MESRQEVAATTKLIHSEYPATSESNGKVLLGLSAIRGFSVGPRTDPHGIKQITVGPPHGVKQITMFIRENVECLDSSFTTTTTIKWRWSGLGSLKVLESLNLRENLPFSALADKGWNIASLPKHPLSHLMVAVRLPSNPSKRRLLPILNVLSLQRPQFWKSFSYGDLTNLTYCENYVIMTICSCFLPSKREFKVAIEATPVLPKLALMAKCNYDQYYTIILRSRVRLSYFSDVGSSKTTPHFRRKKERHPWRWYLNSWSDHVSARKC